MKTVLLPLPLNENPLGFLKINIDGSSFGNLDKSFSFGSIVRNKQGIWVEFLQLHWSHYPMQAELDARHGLSLAWKLEPSHTVLCTNVLSVLISKITVLPEENHDFQLRRVLREANHYADTLAKNETYNLNSCQVGLQ